MFLQACGTYLDYKIELGQIDQMYAYAQESLLAYARWMADHERPYLDRPEILEYPNETWAAQDMRKSDVFGLAAKHTPAPERERFLERSEFFFNYSVSTLIASPRHALTRPAVLMLTNGLLYPYLASHPGEAAPRFKAVTEFGVPARFVPQRLRAARRAFWVAVAAIAAAATYFTLLLIR